MNQKVLLNSKEVNIILNRLACQLIEKHLDFSDTVLIGIILFVLQLFFCTWWLKTHKQGPLEYIWYKATWISFGKNKKFLKTINE